MPLDKSGGISPSVSGGIIQACADNGSASQLPESGVSAMKCFADAADGRTVRDRSADRDAALLDVQAVAASLSCSTRHVYRLADAGRMPRSVKLGALVRWSRAEILAWIADGCPSCRKGGVRP